MKTLLLTLFLILTCNMHGQIPSINETNKSKSVNKPLIKSTNVITTSTTRLVPTKSVNDTILTETVVTEKNETIVESAVDFEIRDVLEETIIEDQYRLYINKGLEEINLYKIIADSLKLQMKDLQSNNKLTDLSNSRDIQIDNIKAARDKIKLIVSKRNKVFRWFPSWPTKSRYIFQREAFYNEYYDEDDVHTNFLNNFSLTFSDNSTTAQSELISDYIEAFRLSFGTVLTASENSESDGVETESESEALKRLINGGGNFYIAIQLPIYSFKTLSFSALTSLNGKLSSDIKGVGNDVVSSDWRGMVYQSAYVALSTDSKKFNFFINADYGFIRGSDSFYNQFNLDKSFNKPAFFGKAIIGVTLNNLIRVTITTKSFSNYSSLVSDKVLVGIQLLK